MILRIAAAAALLIVPVSTFAQSQQEQLDARYDRALAAGYKALMLCSAIANAERNGTTRSPESVEEWELTGIQAPLDGIVRDLPYRLFRADDGSVRHVEVSWADDMPPRIAKAVGNGCAALPIGTTDTAGFSTTIAYVSSPDTRMPGTFVSEGSGESMALADRRAEAGPLDAVFGQAFDGQYGQGTRTTSVLVRKVGVDNGWTESSAYKDGFDENTPQRTWSVAKSIAATLVGAAVQRQQIAVGDTVGVGDGEDDPRRAITIDHLLRMASGRYSDTPGNRTDPLYFGGSSVTETATHWPLIQPPGKVFRYANNDTLLAIQAISSTFGEHPPAEMFAKLGMYGTVAETDAQGAYVLSSQVWSTPGDLANLGELYLNDGLWNGIRILPAGWVNYVSSPSGPQPDGPFGYGAGFWLLNRSEGVPPDTFAAMGNRGQYVVIVPSRDVVLVRRGEDPIGSRFDIAAFTRDVLAALPE